MGLAKVLSETEIDLVFARDFRDGFEVDHFQQRIARRFDPNHARVRLDALFRT